MCEPTKKYNIVAIIPARHGSKRIELKNIKLYAGKPLIYYSITLAKKSKYINRVIVSTDSEDIAKVARKYGAEVPFIRPADISGDLSTDYEFMKHYIDSISRKSIFQKSIFQKSIDTTVEKIPDIIVHLRPTYPNRELSVLDDCIEKFIKVINSYDSLRTVCKTDKPPFKMYTIYTLPEDTDESQLKLQQQLVPLFPTLTVTNKTVKEPYNMPAQLLPTTYWHNGYIDIIKVATIIDQKSMSGERIYPYVMSNSEIDDIDTLEEWEQSEKKYMNNIFNKALDSLSV